jgi:hypothetical protein
MTKETLYWLKLLPVGQDPFIDGNYVHTGPFCNSQKAEEALIAALSSGNIISGKIIVETT